MLFTIQCFVLQPQTVSGKVHLGSLFFSAPQSPRKVITLGFKQFSIVETALELVVTNYFHPRHFEVVRSIDQWNRLKSIRFLSTKYLRIYRMLPVHVVKQGSSIVTFSFAKYLVQLSGGSRGGAWGARPPPLFWQKKKNNEKTQKEKKPAGQAIFANQFCFNISKKPGPPS